MMQPRPCARDRATRHGAERSRLRGGAEVEVKDDADEEEDEDDVVQQVRQLANDRHEVQREPNHDSADEQPDRAERYGVEEKLLSWIVLTAHDSLFVLVPHVRPHPGRTPLPLLVRLHGYVAEPMEKLDDRYEKERGTGPG